MPKFLSKQFSLHFEKPSFSFFEFFSKCNLSSIQISHFFLLIQTYYFANWIFVLEKSNFNTLQKDFNTILLSFSELFSKLFNTDNWRKNFSWHVFFKLPSIFVFFSYYLWFFSKISMDKVREIWTKMSICQITTFCNQFFVH